MLTIHSLEFGAASFFYICRPIILYTLYYDMYVRHKMPLPSSIQKSLMEEELLRNFRESNCLQECSDYTER